MGRLAPEVILANLTRRQKIHIRSFLQKAILALAAAAILAGIGLLLGHLIRGLFKGREEPAPAATSIPVSETVPEEVPGEASAEPEPASAPDLPDVDVNDWSLRLVSFQHPLEEGFEPELMDIEDGQQFDARAGMHLKKLLEDARTAGYSTWCCSGFRSFETQSYIYWGHVEDYEAQGMSREEAEAATRLAVNYPGCSEHQLGLAMDVLEFQGQDMEPYIGGSGLMLWLEDHCADYGFVVRYPDGKTDITGVEYEPWHLRYVGTCARYIMEHGLCLEEFLALYE